MYNSGMAILTLYYTQIMARKITILEYKGYERNIVNRICFNLVKNYRALYLFIPQTKNRRIPFLAKENFHIRNNKVNVR